MYRARRIAPDRGASTYSWKIGRGRNRPCPGDSGRSTAASLVAIGTLAEKGLAEPPGS